MLSTLGTHYRDSSAKKLIKYHLFFHQETKLMSPPLTYKDAGVDIDAGQALVQRIGAIAKKTRRPGVLSGLGGFGALFELPSGYRQPVLVSGTDGVGTKLKLAIDWKRHEHIGIDLVAMCANDILVDGAEPLFFLDYYATGALDVDIAETVIAGIGQGCEQAGCALIGGETAEMPGVYSGQDYDLAGFCVGIVEKDNLLTGHKIAPGHCILGLPSSGPHANGYSLIRKVLSLSEVTADTMIGQQSMAEALLAPTKIYVPLIRSLMADFQIDGLVHITGGGFTENIPRVLPAGSKAVIDPTAWPRQPVFEWLQKQGDISDQEMLRTFNCGIGMVMIVPEHEAPKILAEFSQRQEAIFKIGVIEATDQAPHVHYQTPAHN
jgi:phosphoribosylformylglycinamidine cyclo-ligase